MHWKYWLRWNNVKVFMVSPSCHQNGVFCAFHIVHFQNGWKWIRCSLLNGTTPEQPLVMALHFVANCWHLIYVETTSTQSVMICRLEIRKLVTPEPQQHWAVYEIINFFPPHTLTCVSTAESSQVIWWQPPKTIKSTFFLPEMNIFSYHYQNRCVWEPPSYPPPLPSLNVDITSCYFWKSGLRKKTICRIRFSSSHAPMIYM